MSPAEFDFLRAFLKQRSGLVLADDKQYLVESRLLPVSRRAGVPGLKELMDKLRQPGNEALIVEVVEAMATNESLFFRDKIPFDHFSETIMPALLKARAISNSQPGNLRPGKNRRRLRSIFARWAHFPSGTGVNNRS